MVFKTFQEDIQAFVDRDPAARSRLEVALCYPGLHAVWLYRVGHWIWKRRLYVIGRAFSQMARWLTGIEIHPGATIGRRLVIDHGYGVVIGETSEIGDDVTLYQGVTLGGSAPSVDSRSQTHVKRHPTLKDGVIVGSGAQIIGPITIAENARIGANAVVTSDIPSGVTAVGIPARVVMPKDRAAVARFVAYGTPAEGCPDPVLNSIESLRGRIVALVERIEDMEGQLRDLRAIETGRPGDANNDDGSRSASKITAVDR